MDLLHPPYGCSVLDYHVRNVYLANETPPSGPSALRPSRSYDRCASTSSPPRHPLIPGYLTNETPPSGPSESSEVSESELSDLSESEMVESG